MSGKNACFLILLAAVMLTSCTAAPESAETPLIKSSPPAESPEYTTPKFATPSSSPTETVSPAPEMPDMPETPTPSPETKAPPHEGFVYVSNVVADVILDIRYYGTDNFVGANVDGYLAPVALLTIEAADALKSASDALREQGYALKIFDAYRPRAAVDHFIRWAADTGDVSTKDEYYPDISKNRLFADGYIARRSGHSRGSTVDLTIVDMSTGEEVDMGSPFDFFGSISHFGTNHITKEQADNRMILRRAMENAGFTAYSKEWWHYTLANEPYPDTYFEFYVE